MKERTKQVIPTAMGGVLQKVLTIVLVLCCMIMEPVIYFANFMQVLAAEESTSNSDLNKAPQNISRQQYRNHADPVAGYMVKTDSGYMTVSSFFEFDAKGGEVILDGITLPAANSAGVLVQNYDNSFALQSQQLIPVELQYFGGFFEGNDAYYLVFGHDNLTESDEQEVMRVVKFDKNWKRLGEASLKGADTYKIFQAGSLRMTEYNGYLYVRTCHTLYGDSNGLHHQGNLTMIVNETNLSEVSWCDSDVSHSFNQFVQMDDNGNLIILDQGDGFPSRGFLLSKFDPIPKAIGNKVSKYFDGVRLNIFSFQGNDGDNYTGACLGGLEYSASHYLTAFSSVNQDEQWIDNTAKNIYVSATSKEDFSKDGTTINKITDYADGSSVIASAPRLVKISENFFLLLWEEDIYDGTIRSRKGTGKICYVFLNGKGEKVGSIKTEDGYLSDCQPIVSGNNICWYTADLGKLKFYTLDYSNGTLRTYRGNTNVSEVSNEKDGIKVTWEKNSKAVKYAVYRQQNEGSSFFDTYKYQLTIFGQWEKIGETSSTDYLDKNVVNGKSYYYTVRGLNEDGTWIESDRLCYDIEGMDYERIVQPDLEKIENEENGIQITWSTQKYNIPVYIYRKQGKEDWQKIAELSQTTSYTDQMVLEGETYTYTVQANYFNKYFSSYDNEGMTITRDTSKVGQVSIPETTVPSETEATYTPSDHMSTDTNQEKNEKAKNDTISVKTKKKNAKIISVTAKKGSKTVSGRVTPEATVKVTIYQTTIRIKDKVKITLKESIPQTTTADKKGKFSVKFSKKLVKGTKVKVVVIKSGYKKAAKKLTIK